MRLQHILGCISVAFLLYACGGGGSDSEPSAPENRILVNAGADQNVIELTTVTLGGEARSGDESLSYRWSASPSLTITHESTAAPAATFVAPSVTEQTIYTLTLVVTSASGNQGQDTVLVTVIPDNIPPVAIITVQQFENIAANTIPAGTQVTLSGSQSKDADAAEITSPIQAWNWQQTAGVDVLEGEVTETSELTFTAPVVENRDSIGISLTVTDAEGATNTAQIVLTLLASDETPPSISAGVDQYLFSGETILLSGDATSSVAAATPLNLIWESEPALTISNTAAAQTFAIAPDVASSTDFVFELTVTDQFGNQVFDELVVNVRPAPLFLLTDTGVDLQANENTVNTSQQYLYPGQDGVRGQDVIQKNGLLEKAGRGRVGFDYTPLNNNGDEMDDLSSAWRCVRDNTTGLIWETKASDGGLQDINATFSWFASENNGGFAGDEHGAGAVCSLTNCNTEAYIAAINTQGLCGFYDWRLPTHDELMSILDFGAVSALKIDRDYFPMPSVSHQAPSWYWSSQPGADGVADDLAQNAWALDFSSGVDNFLNKSTPVRVRLVRAGR